jgi:DNA-directed RNA polymerase alpha subunit
MKPSAPSLLERWPTALPVELIGPALAMVEVAFNHGNEEEAHAAVRRVFASVAPSDTVTLDSPLVDLGLNLRITNSLEADGVLTIGQLCEMTVTEIYHRPNFGRKYADAIREALAKHGWTLRYESVEGVTNLRPLPSKKQWLNQLVRRRQAG